MKNHEAQVFVTDRDGGEVETWARYDYFPGQRGYWNGLKGEGCEEIPPSIEVTEVLYEGHWLPADYFTPGERAQWEEDIMEQIMEKEYGGQE